MRGEDNRKSRNTRLNHDENFDDVNDAFEQAIKVLQNIKGIVMYQVKLLKKKW
ncbi:hypothetical protein [uncultured Eubacterium sp.]|uniref:hypothetical protein n=1 Tax=uncultured Eubacterium sp. TaxID=165185 RepID=UPI00260175DB|nr:hypothetical protein [uncultured Eubacterium sp.]